MADIQDGTSNVMVVGEGSVGATLYTGAARGGAQALGRNAGEIAPLTAAEWSTEPEGNGDR